MRTDSITRRQVLRTSALASGVFLAGCGGDDGNGSDGDDDGDGNGGDGGNGTDTGDGDSGNGGGSEQSGIGEPGSCTPGFEEGDESCTALADAMGVLVRWDGEGAASLVEFAYPCGWSAPENSPDFSADHTQTNVGHRFGEDGANLDIQFRTYFTPAEEGFVESELENPNKSAVEYEYDGETRTAAVTDVIDEEIGPGAELTVPNPETGTDHRVSITPTLHGGPCAEQVRGLIVEIVKSLQPNEGTTFEAAPAGTTTAE